MPGLTTGVELEKNSWAAVPTSVVFDSQVGLSFFVRLVREYRMKLCSDVGEVV